MCEILNGIQPFSFKKMHFKMSSAKCRPLCLRLNGLSEAIRYRRFTAACIRMYVYMRKLFIGAVSYGSVWEVNSALFIITYKHTDASYTQNSKGQVNICNTMRPIQNCGHFADGIFKCIFLNENAWISLKFVPNVRINNIPALVQIMAWCWPGEKPLSGPLMDSLLTHICVTRPQWVLNSVRATCFEHFNTF